ncbi:MAG TPA: MBL fold metallo-hydrolase [Caulobacteraceae bacterium]|jgi:glyoxylase-like metal-dependent hydrolase (beta-lactamase superfamily II)|nr:MBL fold metallo-hydrolase [Caulobacteraceae bacterium]
MGWTRRDALLGATLFSAAGWGFAARAMAADAPAPAPFKLEDLGHGVFAGIDIDGHAGSNAGFVIGDDGVLVVDTYYAPNAAPALLAEIRKRTDKKIRYVVNTHYHIDHVSGNATFKAEGATIVAQRNVAAWIHAENPKFYGDKITPEQRAAIAAIPAPTMLVDKRATLKLGKRMIEVVERPGHTGGDVTVAIPDAKVLFCGDLLWREIPPNLIDGTVSKWIPTLQAIETAPHAAELTYVPGHGGIAKLSDVTEFRGYLEALRDATKVAMAHGLSGDTLNKAVIEQLTPRYGSWPYFARSVPREVGYMKGELDGTKHWPQPQTAR